MSILAVCGREWPGRTSQKRPRQDAGRPRPADAVCRFEIAKYVQPAPKARPAPKSAGPSRVRVLLVSAPTVSNCKIQDAGKALWYVAPGEPSFRHSKLWQPSTPEVVIVEQSNMLILYGASNRGTAAARSYLQSTGTGKISRRVVSISYGIDLNWCYHRGGILHRQNPKRRQAAVQLRYAEKVLSV